MFRESRESSGTFRGVGLAGTQYRFRDFRDSREGVEKKKKKRILAIIFLFHFFFFTHSLDSLSPAYPHANQTP